MAEIARSQHGVVSLPQLIDSGFTVKGVSTLSAAGKLHRVHRGVYALSPAALSGPGNRMAAVLACGPGALLASRSAAGHLGLITNSSSVIDVMTIRHARRSGIRTHRMPCLREADRTDHLDIPCTSVARTLLDLAALGRRAELQAALEQAEELGVFDLNALSDVLDRNRGRRGAKRLRAAILAMTADDHLFRSEFERRFLPISRSAGMPEPLVNHIIHLPDGTIEVDFYWPDLRLVVEVDGYRFHGHRRNFREDRRRDRRLAAVGIRCIRYVWEDLVDPAGVERELGEICMFNA